MPRVRRSEQVTSAAAAQEVAGAAAVVGARTSIAAIGACGAHPSNAEIDLLRLGARRSGLQVTLDWVSAIGRHPEHVTAVRVNRPILSPHVFVGNLWLNNRARFSRANGNEKP